MLHLTHTVLKVGLNTFDLAGLPLYSEAMGHGVGTAGIVKEVTFLTYSWLNRSMSHGFS